MTKRFVVKRFEKVFDPEAKETYQPKTPGPAPVSRCCR